MTQERFNQILKEEGFMDKEFMSCLWDMRPDDIDVKEDASRVTCQWFMANIGEKRNGRPETEVEK